MSIIMEIHFFLIKVPLFSSKHNHSLLSKPMTFLICSLLWVQWAPKHSKVGILRIIFLQGKSTPLLLQRAPAGKLLAIVSHVSDKGLAKQRLSPLPTSE